MTAGGASRAGDRVLLSPTALATIAGTFFFMGALAAAYGPLLEHLTRRYGVDLAMAGSAVSAHFAGAVLGVVVSMRAMERISGRFYVAVALGCLGLGCAGVALASSWPTFLGAVVVIGVGFGALDIGLNQLVAHSRGPRRSALLNVLNGAYGVGAVASPILVSRLGQAGLAPLYAGGALLAVCLVPGVVGISGRLPVTRLKAAGGPRLLVGLFVVAFVLYVGMENGVGGWMTSHLEWSGLGAVPAATLTSGFWLAMALGRLLIPLLPARVPEPAIVLSGSATAALALLAALIGAGAPYAYLLVGLAIAPIFPTGIVWLARLLPGDSRATSWLFPASMLGGALVPGATGLVVAEFGIRWAPAVLVTVAIGSFVAFWLAGRQRSLRLAAGS